MGAVLLAALYIYVHGLVQKTLKVLRVHDKMCVRAKCLVDILWIRKHKQEASDDPRSPSRSEEMKLGHQMVLISEGTGVNQNTQNDEL